MMCVIDVLDEAVDTAAVQFDESVLHVPILMSRWAEAAVRAICSKCSMCKLATSGAAPLEIPSAHEISGVKTQL